MMRASAAIFVAASVLSCGPPPEPTVPPASVSAPTVFTVASSVSPTFLVRRLTLRLDGQPLVERADEPLSKLDAQGIEVASTTLAGGAHTLAVDVELQGHGFGVFAYLSNYRFKAHEQFGFEVIDGRRRIVRCTTYEQGGPTTPIEERPRVRCEVKAD